MNNANWKSFKVNYDIPNKVMNKAETIFQRTQLSIILNRNENFLSFASTLY